MSSMQIFGFLAGCPFTEMEIVLSHEPSRFNASDVNFSPLVYFLGLLSVVVFGATTCFSSLLGHLTFPSSLGLITHYFTDTAGGLSKPSNFDSNDCA
jgi:hypothetical protein